MTPVEAKALRMLHLSIAQVAPIHGISWNPLTIQFADAATSSQRAAAQAILDAFDPVAAQEEVEAEEAAEKTRAEKLRALAEWLRTQSKDVREKFADIQSAMESGRSEIAENRQHIKYIEQFISAKYPAAFKPQQWSQTGAAGETGDGQRNG